MDTISKARRERADDILEAIPVHHGNVSAVCKALGFSRTTFYAYAKEFPEINKVLEEAREQVGEQIEGTLVTKALEGNMTAIIFYLKTQRGWKETTRHEVEATVKKWDDKRWEEFNESMAEWEAAHEVGGE